LPRDGVDARAGRPRDHLVAFVTQFSRKLASDQAGTADNDNLHDFSPIFSRPLMASLLNTPRPCAGAGRKALWPCWIVLESSLASRPSRELEVPFLFENYCLDAERRELRRDDELIATGPKVFDLLLFLVENREQVVTRDDLLSAVWV